MRVPRLRLSALAVLLAVIGVTAPVRAIEWKKFEGEAHGFPVMRDAATGTPIADGDFQQWIQNGKLHVLINYMTRGRRIEERVVMSQRPELIQESWSFVESRDGKPFRRFDVDFGSGHATAVTYPGGLPKQQDAMLKATRGEAFAGFGFTMVMNAMRERLIRGEHATLQAVGFTPAPRLVDVDISYGGRDRLRMSGRPIDGDRFIVHPKIPALAKLFVHVPDAQIWLTTPPAGFLRWEGALVQPDDEIVRVDLMPGAQSGPARPVPTTGLAR